MGLEFDVLKLLVEKELRSSEIRKRLFPKWKKKYDSTRSFDVIIIRTLSKKLGKFVDKHDRGHQRVYYAINEHGVEELERKKLRGQLDNWIDELSLEEIQSWLVRFKEHGLRLKFTDKIEVRDKTGKLKGKGLGIVYYSERDSLSKKHGISFTFTVSDKNGRKLAEYEANRDGKFVRKNG